LSVNPEILTRYKELLEKKAAGLSRQLKYEHDNRLEFFGVVDSKLALTHNNCCRLFRGANPKQAELLAAWGDPKYKVLPSAERIVSENV